jgi:putative phosphoribosyl transferase
MRRKSLKLAKEALFFNRKDAGEKLAACFANFDLKKPLVLALPRGGVPVAIEISKALVAPLDLLLVRKLSTSWQPEMAVGAIFGGTHPYTVVNEDIARTMGITEADVIRIAKIQFEELEHRRHLWLGGRQRVPIAGRDTIVVDDGIATGASVRVALEVARRESPSRLILACPVVSTETAESLRGLCDDVIFLATPRYFVGVSEFYRDFRQISDGEVKHLLQHALG